MNEWHVLGMIQRRDCRGSNYHWLCECRFCQKRTIIWTASLRLGKRRCECRVVKVQRVQRIPRQTLRYLNATEHQTWLLMRRRHGNRVCKRWRASFEAFLEDMGKRPLGCALSRWDHRKGYSKENCYWKPGGGQGHRLIEYKGKMIPRAVFLRESGVTYDFMERCLHATKPKDRIKVGDEIEAAHKKYRKLLLYREERYRAKLAATSDSASRI